MFSNEEVRLKIKRILIDNLGRPSTQIDAIVNNNSKFGSINPLLDGLEGRIPGMDWAQFRAEVLSGLGIKLLKRQVPKDIFRYGDYCDFVHGKQSKPPTIPYDKIGTAAVRRHIPLEMVAVDAADSTMDVTEETQTKETFESFLIDHGINVFGKWADPANDTTLEICHCHPSKKGATIKWTSNNGQDVGFALMGGDEEISPLVKGRDKTTRTVADGFCFVESGAWDLYKMIASFEFKNKSSTNIANRNLQIRPFSKADSLDKYSYISITCDPEKPAENRAILYRCSKGSPKAPVGKPMVLMSKCDE